MSSTIPPLHPPVAEIGACGLATAEGCHGDPCADIRALLQDHHARLSAQISREIGSLRQHIPPASLYRGSGGQSQAPRRIAPPCKRNSGAAVPSGALSPWVPGMSGEATSDPRTSVRAMPSADDMSTHKAWRLQLNSDQSDLLDSDDRHDRNVAAAEGVILAEGERVKINQSIHPSRPGLAAAVRARCQTIVSSYVFEFFFAVMIMTNSIHTGVSVQFYSENPNADTPVYMFALQLVYAFVFFVELVFRSSAMTKEHLIEGWSWMLLDLIIVAGCVMEVAADILYKTGSTTSQSSGSEVASVRVARIVRITKLLRVLRIARVTRFLRALRTLVYSILCTLRSLVWSMLLLMLIMYVFGILFTQATIDFLREEGVFDENEPAPPRADLQLLQQYWGSVPNSMLTLFGCISGGISWYDAAPCLQAVGMPLFLLFLSYISFTIFAVLNVVTGVFCQSAIENTANDREIMVQALLENNDRYVEELTLLFHNMDLNEDGGITLQEFERHLKDEEVTAHMASLEIDARDCWTLFKLLDQDKSHVIDIDEFVLGCTRLKGVARSIDIAKLTYDSRWLMKQLAAFMSYTELQFNSLATERGCEVLSEESAALGTVHEVLSGESAALGYDLNFSSPVVASEVASVAEPHPQENPKVALRVKIAL